MKTILLFLAFGGVAALQAQTTNTQKMTPKQRVQAAYTRGLIAEQAGKIEEARQAYNEVLRIHPRNPDAQYRLGELKISERKMAQRGRDERLNDVMLPAVQLEEAPLRDALELLTLAIEKQSDKKITPGFVTQDPSNQLDAARITLNLKNVPAKAALDYVLAQAGAQARYDPYAVVITPRGE